MLADNDTSEDSEWLYSTNKKILIYMTILATEIAKQNNLSMNTHISKEWDASSVLLHDGKIQKIDLMNDEAIEDYKTNLAYVIINDIFPENILDIWIGYTK